MVDKSELAIATSQAQNPIPFLIELLFNLLSKIITISTIKLTSQPVRPARLADEKLLAILLGYSPQTQFLLPSVAANRD